ncbi:hypothetical protein CLOP_g2666 [Closterium sp. NIES-67]|nr:hypothetical protein CLOP_g2666 [Closterium sp. NIES-67]
MDALQRLLPPFLIDEIETHLSSRRAFAAFAAVERCILEDRSHRRVFDKLVAPLADRNGPCAKEGRLQGRPKTREAVHSRIKISLRLQPATARPSGMLPWHHLTCWQCSSPIVPRVCTKWAS